MYKFLYFANSTSDAGAIPASLLRKMLVNTTSTGINLKFKDVGDGLGQEVDIALTINTDKPKEVIQAISDEIRCGRKPMIVIADDLNGEYIHPDVTAVGTISLT
jgi:hypothetical protein